MEMEREKEEEVEEERRSGGGGGRGGATDEKRRQELTKVHDDSEVPSTKESKNMPSRWR